MQWTIGVSSGFIGVDWEVDWGTMDMMLSSIALELAGISQQCQKGVMGCNKGPVQFWEWSKDDYDCEGYTTPYNKSPFPGALLAMMATGNHNNIDTLQY